MDDKIFALNLEFLNAQSRSFAIPIARMNGPLKNPFICFYNTNKLLDIIEDTSSIVSINQKIEFMDKLCDSLKDGTIDVNLLNKMISYGCSDTNYYSYYPSIMSLYNHLSPEERSIIYHEITTMSFGMKKYLVTPINSIEDHNDYCFYAAGIVGQHVNELLYITYKNVMGPDNKDKLLEYSLSFGLFLQKINNIRDYYEDTFVMKKPRWPKNITSINTPIQSLNIMCKDCIFNDALPAIKYLELLPELDKGFENFIKYILYSGLYYFQFLINNPDVLLEEKVKVPKEFIVNLYTYVDEKPKNELIKELYALYKQCTKLISKACPGD